MEGRMTERALAKRDQIRAGARRIFLERGFARAGTDDIAAEAGVSKQTLYVYYANKEELLADVLRQLVIEGPQAPLANLEALDPHSGDELREALVERVKNVVGVMMSPDYLALLRIIIAEAPRMPNLGDVFRSTVPERGIKMFSGVLERTNERGVTDVPDTDVAARMLIGAIVTYALLDGLLVPEEPITSPSTQKIEQIVALYMKAIA